MKFPKLNRKREKTERAIEEDWTMDYWRWAVKQRDGFVCQQSRMPGDFKSLAAHHIFSRGKSSVKYSIDDGVTLRHGNHFNAHKYPEKFRDWIIGWMGSEKHAALKLKAGQNTHLRWNELWVIRGDLAQDFLKFGGSPEKLKEIDSIYQARLERLARKKLKIKP